MCVFHFRILLHFKLDLLLKKSTEIRMTHDVLCIRLSMAVKMATYMAIALNVAALVYHVF